MNDNLVLISGKSSTGKSASLRNLKDPTGVLYLNCENNKKLPFKTAFKQVTITDPMKVLRYFDPENEQLNKFHTIVIDSLTFLMDLYESLYVVNSSNTMGAWGDYAQYGKQLFAHYIANCGKSVIVIAHTSDVMNEKEMALETMVKVKGSLMNQGIEAFFSTVISSKKVALKDLKKYPNELLNISAKDERLGFKHVFQTDVTKNTIGERMRAPMDMWTEEETFIDNDCALVLQRFHEFYG